MQDEVTCNCKNVKNNDLQYDITNRKMQYKKSSLRVVLTYNCASLLSFSISLGAHMPATILAQIFPFFSFSSFSLSKSLSESAELQVTDLLDLALPCLLKDDFLDLALSGVS